VCGEQEEEGKPGYCVQVVGVGRAWRGRKTTTVASIWLPFLVPRPEPCRRYITCQEIVERVDALNFLLVALAVLHGLEVHRGNVFEVLGAAVDQDLGLRTL